MNELRFRSRFDNEPARVPTYWQMTPGASRHYWRAVELLREAETLANMAGAVSGPADEPPKDAAEESSWVEDWAKRAGETLQKARDWAASKKAVLKSRARRIVNHVRKGVHAINEATVGRAAKTLQTVTDTANMIQFGGVTVSLLLTAGLAYVGWKLFLAPKHAR